MTEKCVWVEDCGGCSKRSTGQYVLNNLNSGSLISDETKSFFADPGNLQKLKNIAIELPDKASETDNGDVCNVASNPKLQVKCSGYY
jgi:hypothetical protein